MTLYKKRLPDPYVTRKSDTDLVRFGHLNHLAKRVIHIEDGTQEKEAVTQLTSKTTGVTINGPLGTITTVALTDAADTEFSFTVTNSFFAVNSVVLLSINMNGSTGFAMASVTPAAGSAVIKVRNVGTAALNAALKISFSIQ